MSRSLARRIAAAVASLPVIAFAMTASLTSPTTPVEVDQGTFPLVASQGEIPVQVKANGASFYRVAWDHGNSAPSRFGGQIWTFGVDGNYTDPFHVGTNETVNLLVMQEALSKEIPNIYGTVGTTIPLVYDIAP